MNTREVPIITYYVAGQGGKTSLHGSMLGSRENAEEFGKSRTLAGKGGGDEEGV